MSLRRSFAVSRHELRVLRRDPFPIIILIVMPLVVMAFIKPTLRFTLVSEGYRGANGSEHAVPGMAVLFAFFLVSFVGYGFFIEHGWGTWERLRASQARSIEIIVGKVLPMLGVAALQQTLLFVAGGALFRLHIRGSLIALALVSIALSFCLVAMGVALVALCRTIQQVNAFGNIGAMIFGGVGGALAPINVLPAWARAVAPATPTYWAMRGFRSVVLDAGGTIDVLLPIAILLAFAVGFGALAALRLRFEETKVSWA